LNMFSMPFVCNTSMPVIHRLDFLTESQKSCVFLLFSLLLCDSSNYSTLPSSFDILSSTWFSQLVRSLTRCFFFLTYWDFCFQNFNFYIFIEFLLRIMNFLPYFIQATVFSLNSLRCSLWFHWSFS
jgi:hypothetical protein